MRPTNYALCRITVALVWLYHGLVPKWLGPDADELMMNQALGLSLEQAETLSYFAGAAEITFAAIILIYWRARWPLMLSALGLIGLLGYVVLAAPQLLMGAFNPVTTNLPLVVLSIVALRLYDDQRA